LDYAKTFFHWYAPTKEAARDPQGVISIGWGPPWEENKTQGKTVQLNYINPVEQAYSLVMLHKPSYVAGRASSLFDLAQEANRQKAKVKLDRMYAFGANISDASREECLRMFGAKIMSIYNSREVYDIAHQCPVSNNHHVSWELMLVEVLDDGNRPCPPGKQGRCVVTPFYNTAQPLIRYDLGDQITLGETCSCGRTLQVISELNGRTLHMFRLPDGRKMSPRFHGFLKTLIGAHEWQFAQTAINTVEVRYLKLSEAPQSGFDELTKIIRAQMTPTTKVVFKPMAKLPLTPAGKLLEAVCELPLEV